MFRKIVVPPQIIHFNRVFHYFHHPFWWVFPPIFGPTNRSTHWQDLFVGNHQGHPGAPNQSLEFLAKKKQNPRFSFLRDWLGWSFPFQKKNLVYNPKQMVEVRLKMRDWRHPKWSSLWIDGQSNMNDFNHLWFKKKGRPTFQHNQWVCWWSRLMVHHWRCPRINHQPACQPTNDLKQSTQPRAVPALPAAIDSTASL